jgi:hypothetical protein
LPVRVNAIGLGVLVLVLAAVFAGIVVSGCGGGTASSPVGVSTVAKLKKADSVNAGPGCGRLSGTNLQVCENAYRVCGEEATGAVERYCRGEGEPFWERARKYAHEGYLAGGPDTLLAEAAELGCEEAMEDEYKRLFR